MRHRLPLNLAHLHFPWRHSRARNAFFQDLERVRLGRPLFVKIRGARHERRSCRAIPVSLHSMTSGAVLTIEILALFYQARVGACDPFIS